jgi:intracellular multiplication protein IcmK
MFKHGVWAIVLFFITLTSAFAQEENAAPSQDMSLNQFKEWVQKNVPTESQTPSSLPTEKTAASTETQPVAPPHGPRIMTFEESQQAMLNSLPPDSMRPSEDSEEAFNTMMQQNMPLAPRQVVRLHQQIDVSQRAAATPPTIPPKPVSTTLMINLAPGTTPPAIRLAQGYVTSLVFVDSTGAPWPIASFDIGSPKSVGIQWDGKSNVLIIQSLNPYSYGDMVIRLIGLATPLTLELVSGQRVVDYRVDIHIPHIGPNTKELPIGTTLPDSANQVLLGVLDGVAPPNSRNLSVRGADAQAWLTGEKIYLRTRLTLLSPGWIGTMSSPDGMHAYELSKTSSVLVSRYGEPAELKIEGF